MVGKRIEVLIVDSRITGYELKGFSGEDRLVFANARMTALSAFIPEGWTDSHRLSPGDIRTACGVAMRLWAAVEPLPRHDPVYGLSVGVLHRWWDYITLERNRRAGESGAPIEEVTVAMTGRFNFFDGSIDWEKVLSVVEPDDESQDEPGTPDDQK